MATNKKASKKVAKKAKKVANKTIPVVKKKKSSKKATSKKATKAVIGKKTTKKVIKKTAQKSTAKKATTAKAKKSTSKNLTKVTKKKVTKKSPSKAKASNSDELIHGIAPYKEKAREKYMNDKQLDHFRSILTAWKESLLDEVSRTIHLMQDENINHPDPNDRASQETDISLELRNRDRERKLLKKIDSTMLRVDSDDYGWCNRCGIEIGIRRLEARPTADLCVDCKTLNEIKERQMI